MKFQIKVSKLKLIRQNFNNFQIRVVLNNKEYFIANDIAKLLGFSSKGSISNALKELDKLVKDGLKEKELPFKTIVTQQARKRSFSK